MEKLELVLAWLSGAVAGWWTHRWWGRRRVRQYFAAIQLENARKERAQLRDSTDGWSK